jgi:hypothetical protein
VLADTVFCVVWLSSKIFDLYLIVMPYPGMGGVYWQARLPDLLEACQVLCTTQQRLCPLLTNHCLSEIGDSSGIGRGFSTYVGPRGGNKLSRLDECSFRGRGHFEDVLLEN